MSTRVLLQHQTKYLYDSPVFLSPQLVRLKPAMHCRTPIEAYSFIVSPANHVVHWQQDPFGNFIARIDFNGPVSELIIDVKLIADLAPISPFDFFVDQEAQFFPFEYDTQLKKDLAAYLEIVDKGPMMKDWLEKADLSRRGIVEFLVSINQLVYKNITYTSRLQPGVQTSEESLESAQGSCRDSAWLLAQILRNLGLAARFVSGYLVEVGNDAATNTATQEDSLALHAWTEVFIPGAGWIGLDPTGGLLAAESHIPLACAPGTAGAAPITGTSGVSKTTFSYSTNISRF
ncbi:MAG TPA: transglutaminase family protein [Chitinophagaceae bacterium]|jgi:transglutaminase-like putative cysteine protease|nr:transglutaminase family protein [Chitinophagaceae bacterium]